MKDSTKIIDAAFKELQRQPSELLPHQCEQLAKSLRIYADKLDMIARDPAFDPNITELPKRVNENQTK